MSSTLKIEPDARKKTSLSDQLKFILRKKHGGTVTCLLVSKSDMNYFKALVDCEIEDAQIVIDFIEQYGDCIINEEF